MIRIPLALLLLALATQLASADEPPQAPSLPAHIKMDAPSGWQLLPGLSQKLTATAETADHFSGEATTSAALAYGRANQGAIYLTWVDSLRALPSPETALRQSFDAIHQAPYLASPEAGSTQEISYRERSFDGLVEMTFEWAHMSNATVNIVRTLGWKDQDARVHLAIAECVLPNETSADSRPLCESALASLRLSEAGHAPLHALAEPGPTGPLRPDSFEVPALETGEKALPKVAPAKLNSAPTEVGDVIYDGRGKGSDTDRGNRTFIAIGVVLLGVAVWLTTRSRSGENSESSESGESGESSESGESGESGELDDETKQEDRAE